MPDQLLDTECGANGAEAAAAAEVTDRMITINRSELEQMIAVAVRGSQREFDSDSGSDGEDKTPTNAGAAVASVTSASAELLDEQQVQKCDPVSEAMAHTIRTRLKERMPSEVLDKKERSIQVSKYGRIRKEDIDQPGVIPWSTSMGKSQR